MNDEREEDEVIVVWPDPDPPTGSLDEGRTYFTEKLLGRVARFTGSAAEQVKKAAQIILDANITKRVVPHSEYKSLFDKSLPFDEPRNQIAGLAVAVMEIFELAEPLPNRLLTKPIRRRSA